MMSNNKLLHSGLVSNLNQVLQNRNNNKGTNNNNNNTPPNEDDQQAVESDSGKPILLVTNGDGIDSPGLTFLVQVLVDEGIYSVNVCAPQSDKSVSGHAVTLQETVTVTSVDIMGAEAYEVSGTNNNNNNTPPNEDDQQAVEQSPSSVVESDSGKPILLVTNGDGIDSPGLTFLVQALVDEGIYSVNVCAPQSDKSVSGHAVTLQETVAVTSVDIMGAEAYEVSGTPVDCVSLALSGALFAWSKPVLLISGINKGSRCGSQMLYSGAIAGAREALLCGVPSITISLNWMKDESKESDFQDAVSVCLPIIKAALRDIETGIYPKGRSLNIEIPKSPLTNKGFKLTKQSLWRSPLSWQAVSTNRQGNFMSNQQSLGLQLAQLGRDASAAGAARRLGTQKQSLEIVESVGVAGKSDFNRVKKYFRQEFLDKEQEDMDEDLDFRALENGFVTVTPLFISSHIDPEAQAAASDWISSALDNI